MDENDSPELRVLNEMEKNVRNMIPSLESMKELDVGSDAKKKALELLTSLHTMTLKALVGIGENKS